MSTKHTDSRAYLMNEIEPDSRITNLRSHRRRRVRYFQAQGHLEHAVHAARPAEQPPQQLSKESHRR